MADRDIILRCLHENWPGEVSMIGNNLVTRIVDDALKGNKTKLRVPRGGFNFDLAPHIDTIIAGAALLVALAQFYVTIRDIPDRTDEELVRILAQFLMDEMKVKPGKATKLARLFIRISRVMSNGR